MAHELDALDLAILSAIGNSLYTPRISDVRSKVPRRVLVEDLTAHLLRLRHAGFLSLLIDPSGVYVNLTRDGLNAVVGHLPAAAVKSGTQS